MRCESGLRQFDKNGNVLRGVVNPLDTGIAQINLKYHGARAEELGYDLFTEDGNIAFAKLLYKEQGTKPWHWSRHCWGSKIVPSE